MIELDMIALAVTILILYILLMVINYRGFTEYPDKYLEQNPFGAGILKNKGAVWFVVCKFAAVLASVLVVVPISLFFPTHYSYTWLGFVLGLTWLNLYHDYLTYKQVTRNQ